MRRHTLIGERIIAAAPALEPVARIVRSSHERWDGAGYPDAIAGEQIPLGARIVAVADAFDAMTSRRPYCEPRTETDALDELRRCASGAVRPRGRRGVLRGLGRTPVDGLRRLAPGRTAGRRADRGLGPSSQFIVRVSASWAELRAAMLRFASARRSGLIA